MSIIKKYVYTVPLDIIHYIYKFLDVKTVFSKSIHKFIYCFGLFHKYNEPLIENVEFKDFFFTKKRQTPTMIRRRPSIVNEEDQVGLDLESFMNPSSSSSSSP
jgi:hypothetical protein